MLRFCSDNSLMGSESEKWYLAAKASNSLNSRVFLYSPMAAIPPFLMDFDGSGMIFSRSTSATIPRPLQCSHAPYGELNEKVLGSGSG